MYEDLKQLLGREVDLVVDGSLRPYAQESANEIKSWYMRELVRDKGRLEDIVEFSSNVLKIIDGIEFEEFSSNILVYFATVKNVEVVGEAA